MIGRLSPAEVEELLSQQIIGRIGCCSEEMVYVVPISYAYQDNCVYCHTYEGRKMQMMRNHPEVCFQVDETKDMANWKSVIAWGRFDEVNEKEERAKALKILLQRRLPVLSSVTTHLGKTWPFSGYGGNGYNEIPGLVFKIILTAKSGRFEKAAVSQSFVLS